jgi:hypothetical protein
MENDFSLEAVIFDYPLPKTSVSNFKKWGQFFIFKEFYLF